MITEATQSDLSGLVPLFRSLNDLHAVHVPDRFHDAASDADLHDVLQGAWQGGSRFLVYRTEGVARGYLKWQMMPVGIAALERPRRIALLDHIWVEPIWRRRGLASRLIDRFEQDSAGAGAQGWTVRVHAFNAASAALMRRHGAELSVQAFDKYAAPAPTSAPTSA